MAAAGLPSTRRARVILLGIIAATVMRILFAFITVQLLQIIGLVLAGGLLLLWVCWKLWRELEERRRNPPPRETATPGEERTAPKTTRSAIVQIVVADLSMSLDNVLAVAGIAREHTWVLVVGLTLSVALMGFSAAFVARLLERYHWIAYIGLLVITYVAFRMIVEGAMDVALASLPASSEPGP
jgi:YjbE family integral membrane protein